MKQLPAPVAFIFCAPSMGIFNENNNGGNNGGSKMPLILAAVCCCCCLMSSTFAVVAYLNNWFGLKDFIDGLGGGGGDCSDANSSAACCAQASGTWDGAACSLAPSGPAADPPVTQSDAQKAWADYGCTVNADGTLKSCTWPGNNQTCDDAAKWGGDPDKCRAAAFYAIHNNPKCKPISTAFKTRAKVNGDYFCNRPGDTGWTDTCMSESTRALKGKYVGQVKRWQCAKTPECANYTRWLTTVRKQKNCGTK